MHANTAAPLSSARLAPPAGGACEAPTFVGKHPAHLAAIRALESLAPFEHATVLVEGESGTGKSYAAKLLHHGSARARSVFLSIVLSTLDDNLAASDLFGHLSGSYTDARTNRPGYFVTANRGTLFLDEIGKASPSVQRKLLHAIEHKEIYPVGSDRSIRLDVRLVTATNIPLETLVERGTFLDDLAARLLTFRVRLPALRERRSDIPALVRQFVALRAPMCGHPLRAPAVHPDLMELFEQAAWPYNLRQLDGVLQRIMIEAAAADSSALDVAHCPRDVMTAIGVSTCIKRMPSQELVRERMKELKSVVKTAESLGVSRWTVNRYLRDSIHSEAASSA